MGIKCGGKVCGIMENHSHICESRVSGGSYLKEETAKVIRYFYASISV